MPRPRNHDLNGAVRAIVAEEIVRALAPYRDLLDRLSLLAGIRRGPGRPRGTHSGSRAVRGESFKEFAPGTKVRYRQGRGAFVAEVLSQDVGGTVTVKRVDDGKEVQRDPDTLRKV